MKTNSLPPTPENSPPNPLQTPPPAPSLPAPKLPQFKDLDPEIQAYLKLRKIVPDQTQIALLAFLAPRVWVCRPLQGGLVLAITAEGVGMARTWLMVYGATHTVKRTKHMETFLGHAQGLRMPPV